MSNRHKLTNEQQAQVNRLNDRQTQFLAREVAEMAHGVERRPWPFKSLGVRSVRKRAEAGSLTARLVLRELERDDDD